MTDLCLYVVKTEYSEHIFTSWVCTAINLPGVETFVVLFHVGNLKGRH